MFKFPFTNFHELNLDWILSVVKEAKAVFDNGASDIAHAVETSEQALTVAQQAASGVIGDGAVTTPKLADGAVTNIKLANNAVTSNKISASAVTVDKLASGALIRKNILDNWCFLPSYIINQRGQTLYPNRGYCIDRWSNASVNNQIEVTAQGLKITNTSPTGAGTINQFINSAIVGTRVTGSLFFSDGHILSGSGVFPALGGANVTLVDRTGRKAGCVLENHEDSNPCFTITTNPDSECILVAVKLEIGTTQTLIMQDGGVNVLTELPDFAAELEKCHRFYWRGGQYERTRAAYIGQNSIQFFIATPETMSRRPDIDGSLIIESLTGTVQDGFTFSVLYVATNGIGISAAKNSHGLTDAVLRLNQTAFIAE